MNTSCFWMIALQGCQTHFPGGHISLAAACKGPNIILGLYKCNYSVTHSKRKYWTRWNKVEGRIWPTGLVFATCALERILTMDETAVQAATRCQTAILDPNTFQRDDLWPTGPLSLVHVDFLTAAMGLVSVGRERSCRASDWCAWVSGSCTDLLVFSCHIYKKKEFWLVSI